MSKGHKKRGPRKHSCLRGPHLQSFSFLFKRRRLPTLPHCIAVPSAQVGLTSLFGMGRGGTPPLKPPGLALTYLLHNQEHRFPLALPSVTVPFHHSERFRAISSARLWRRRLWTCTLSTSSSLTALYGALISRLASHLDAFSAYPAQTRIPGDAPGGTTGTPEVCPSRSSRTSDGTAQNSRAHDR